MIEEPLVSSGRESNGEFDKKFWIPTISAGVLGLGFLCTLIALIAVAASHCKEGSSVAPVVISSSAPVPPVTPSSSSSSFVPPPHVSSSSSASSSSVHSSSSSSGVPSFKEFSATMQSMECDSFAQHCAMGETTTISAFGIGQFCMVDHNDNGDETVRQFSDMADESYTVCEVVNDHKNCYKLSTYSDTIEFSLDGLDLIARNISCSRLSPTLVRRITQSGRSLSMCDYYVATNLAPPEYLSDAVYQIIVETGTNYPVIEFVKDFETASVSMSLFLAFDPHKPQDEGCMQPYPDVTVYDFRDNDEPTKKRSFSTKKRSANVEMIAKTMERRKKVRQLAQIPMYEHSWRLKPSTHKVSIRDPRDIPSEFDARVEWPYCSNLIGTITNQEMCGSCWAMSGSAVLADRSCVSNMSNAQLSPQYMVYCGDNTFGCQGGGTTQVWDQLMSQGTVSEECVPFTARNGACPRKCRDGSEISDSVKVFATSYVTPWANDPAARVHAIQSEIMEHGSVQAGYIVFDDFYDYSGGVYQRSGQSYYAGMHAVRVIGWGTENGVDYWLVANSWDTDWGEDGFFKIRRGNNECNFEEQIIAGLVN